MRVWAAAISAAVLAVMTAAAADPLDGHECFSSDNDRRIAGCTELIERSGVAGQLLGSAYAMRALAYSLKGLYDTAIADYDEAIRLVPDFAVALNNRAWAYFKSGRPEAGLPDVERSLELQPTSPHAYDTRAHIRQATGNPSGAISDYDAAMRFGGERMIQLYQCGLSAIGLYVGPVDGVYTVELRRAMEACVANKDCDPLPPDEECRAATS